MDQRTSYRCSRHKKMDHDYPECVAEARVAAPVAKLEPAVVLAKRDLAAAPKFEPIEAPRTGATTTMSKTVSKTTGALTNAEHQARWRKAHPEKHADQRRAARARKASS